MTSTLDAPARTLPGPRGPLSETLLEVLHGADPELLPTAADADPLGEDVQLCLHLLYGLHYRAAPGVDDALEWDPEVLRFRAALERLFLAAVREAVHLPAGGLTTVDEVDDELAPLLVEPVHGTGLSWHLAAGGEPWQLREYVAHRSIYHLKEGDPQSFAIPRLEGAAKAAYVAVQHDEYGAGRAERMHSELFRAVLRESDLDDSYGGLVEHVGAETLAPDNLMSLAGLHRSLLGVAYGQLVLVEVTSSPGSRRVAKAFRRLGTGPAGDGGAGAAFYDEHVEADAVHEQVLRAGLRSLLAAHPQQAGGVLLGLRGLALLEERLGAHLLGAWSKGRSSLRRPV